MDDDRYSAEIIQKSKIRYKIHKAAHRRLVRRKKSEDCIKRDTLTNSVLSRDPSKLFQAVRSIRKSSNVPIQKLVVRDRLYEGVDVCDGFYDSISYLKTETHKDLHLSEYFNSANEDYENILKIWENGSKIPKITIEKTKKIL